MIKNRLPMLDTNIILKCLNFIIHLLLLLRILLLLPIKLMLLISISHYFIKINIIVCVSVSVIKDSICENVRVILLCNVDVVLVGVLRSWV